MKNRAQDSGPYHKEAQRLCRIDGENRAENMKLQPASPKVNVSIKRCAAKWNETVNTGRAVLAHDQPEADSTARP